VPTLKPDFSEKSRLKTVPKPTVKLTDLLKVEKKETGSSAAQIAAEADQPFTYDQLKVVWNEFAEQRKKFQAEYQLLTQPFELHEKQITVHLHSSVQDMLLNNLRTELGSFLREKLKNNSITLIGVTIEQEDRKVIYTPREKFDYLLERNPLLRELKDRLGLDTDF
jgi:DNA polymerase-3 subunit gamma/tau